jgi:WD40 repeat protein/DNA-binding SARP family transcriptional activator
MLEIRTFGGLQLASGGYPITDLASRKAEALLVYLVVTGRPQSREVLADIFWDERTQTQAMANLRNVLYSLRKHVGDYLEISREFAAVRPDAEVWLDLAEFKQRLGAAKLNEAISLYKGDFLEGFHIRDSVGFENWLIQERQRCQKLLQEGLHAWVRYHTERGSYRDGIAFAEQLLVIDPLDEEAISQLMVLLTLSGQQAAALKRYTQFCAVLDEELGVEPSQKTQETYQLVLDGKLQDELSGIEPPERKMRVVGECPYRGLAPFREVDSPFFFGREDFTSQLEHAVRNDSVVTVILGASGSGKSSTVYAGLLPHLRKAGGWQIIIVRPGRSPFERLAAEIVGLRNPAVSEYDRLEEIRKLAFRMQHESGVVVKELQNVLNSNTSLSRLLLVVDQFEELYTQCPETEVQHRYLDELLQAANDEQAGQDGAIVLLQTLRADFMGQALAYRPYADALQNATIILGPMNRGELRSAIVNPAKKQGAAFEPGLVERILDDVGEEPGNLPLLEFTLTLLWDRLDHGWFTHAAYEEIGQVGGALTRYAEEVFALLDESQQDQAQKIFTQLVQPGEGAEDTRRVATREELAGDEWSLVQHLADKRLVVTGIDQKGNETVEVVHEVLIRNWGRLRNWMDQNRDFRSWQEGLRAAFRQWEANQEDEGGLLRGRPLVQAESWLDERPADLSETDYSFIQSSIDLRDRRERERSRRRRGIFIGLTAGLLITIALTIFSFIQQTRAQESFSMSLAAHVQTALDENRTDTALALALAANEIPNPPAEVLRVLRQAAYAPGPTRKYAIAEILGYDGHVYSLEASPTDMSALMGMEDGTIFLWDVETEKVIHTLEGHTDVVQDIAFSPDGKTALSASHDGLVILWDLVDGKEIRRFVGHSGWVRAVDFSPDDRTMVSGGYVGASEDAVLNPGELFLWDLETGEIVQRFESHPSGVVAAVFNPDGKSILASSGLFIDILNPYTLYLWDIETGTLIHDFEVEMDNLALAISPDGRTAISGDNLYVVHIWDLETGAEIQTLEGHEGMVRSVAFSPDGVTVLTSDSVGTLIYWDANTWEILMKSRVQQAGGVGWSRFVPMPNIAILPDSRTALSTTEEKTLVVWNLLGAAEIRRFYGHRNYIHATAFTPDGKYALTGSGNISAWAGIPGENNHMMLWDVETGELLHTFEGHTNAVLAIAVSPDGKRALSGDGDGIIRLWDLEKRREIRSIFAHMSGVFSVAISPDAKLGLSGSIGEAVLPDDSMSLWDLETGELLRHFDTGSNQTVIIFLDDGQTAYTQAGGLSLYDLNTGEILETYGSLDTCCTDFVLHPDGEIGYTVTNKTTIIQEWDLRNHAWIREIGHAHGGIRTRLAITPDGQRLFSSASGGNLYLWDLNSGEELYRFYSREINMDIDISPDGKLGLSPGNNNTAILWDLDLPIALDEVKAWIAENRYVRELTCEERATYSITPLCEAEAP